MSNLKFLESLILLHAKDKDNWYFSQTLTTSYADYKPKYPDHTSADLTIAWNNIANEIKMYGNIYSAAPTIKEYSDLYSLCEDIELMAEGGKA